MNSDDKDKRKQELIEKRRREERRRERGYQSHRNRVNRELDQMIFPWMAGAWAFYLFNVFIRGCGI